MSTRFIEGKTCLHCGGPITSRGPKRDAAAIFCGIACRGAYSKAQSIAEGKIVNTNCETCGKPITFYASMRPQGAYCSQSCKSIGHSKKMTGRPPSPFSTGSTFRKSVRRFFYDRCAICGYDRLPNDVCHIIDSCDGGEDTIDNVTMLCPNHHREFDRGLISIETIYETRLAILRPEWQDTPEWIVWTQARSALSNLIRWAPENEEAIAAAREEIKRARRAFETAWQDSGQPVNPHSRPAAKLSEAEARAALESLQANQ